MRDALAAADSAMRERRRAMLKLWFCSFNWVYWERYEEEGCVTRGRLEMSTSEAHRRGNADHDKDLLAV